MPKVGQQVRKLIVHKVTDDMNNRDVHCTTYQMRNPFVQFADGMASELDVHCYFQHAFAADLCPKSGRVLDVCCGRGLLIPFLRYRAAPSLYVGVDISSKNARWADGADPRRESKQKTDWGFDRLFVESDVSDMVSKLQRLCPFDVIVFTSSIEHMQPQAQQETLQQCRQVSRQDTMLYLSCPVTAEDADPWATQYTAHVYEPRLSELIRWLNLAGWQVKRTIGLSTKSSVFKNVLQGEQLEIATRLYRDQPREQALPGIAVLFPACATEVAMVCVQTQTGLNSVSPRDLFEE